MSLVLKHLAAGKTAKEIADEFPELELEDIGERVRYAAQMGRDSVVDGGFVHPGRGPGTGRSLRPALRSVRAIDCHAAPLNSATGTFRFTTS